MSGALVLAQYPVIAYAAEGSGGQGQESDGTPPDMPSGQGGSGGGTGGGANTMTFDYSGTYSGAKTADGQDASSSDEAIDASTAGQNTALAQNGGTLDLSDDTLTKSGDDSDSDTCNFYGANSVVLAVGDKSTAYLTDCQLSATSTGSNGLFSTDGATLYAQGGTISTTADNSRGLDATYGGTIVADGLDVSTQGGHSASVATDRGGGDVSLTDSTISTAGDGSPLLYSTGDIEVSGVTGTASGSQICGMEGLNTVLVNDSTLESTHDGTSGSDPVADGIIIYQSTSGDAASTTGEAATFCATGSTLKSAITSGSMFYLTNTTANIVLKGTTLDFDSSTANLLTAEGNDSNGWGTAGANGATVNFTGIGETLAGTISADTISTADVYLLKGTTWTGTTSITQNATGSTSKAPITVNVDGSSTWVVTADSTVSDLNVASGGSIVDEDGNTVSIVVNGETLVQGTGSTTVTVTRSYSASVSTSSANEVTSCSVDRSGFDDHYGTSTAFEMGSGTAATTQAATTSQTLTTAATATSTEAGTGSWWDDIVSWFQGLFGLS
jgi:hypothetical protein